MERQLDVYFAHSLVGRLIQNEHGRLMFAYTDEWLSQKGAFPLSQTLPLRQAPFAKGCYAFYHNSKVTNPLTASPRDIPGSFNKLFHRFLIPSM